MEPSVSSVKTVVSGNAKTGRVVPAHMDVETTIAEMTLNNLKVFIMFFLPLKLQLQKVSLSQTLIPIDRITQILIQRKEKTEDFYTEFQGILEKQINLMNNLDNKLPNYVYSI